MGKFVIELFLGDFLSYVLSFRGKWTDPEPYEDSLSRAVLPRFDWRLDSAVVERSLPVV